MLFLEVKKKHKKYGVSLFEWLGFKTWWLSFWERTTDDRKNKITNDNNSAFIVTEKNSEEDKMYVKSYLIQNIMSKLYREYSFQTGVGSDL